MDVEIEFGLRTKEVAESAGTLRHHDIVNAPASLSAILHMTVALRSDMAFALVLILSKTHPQFRAFRQMERR